jgi:hypothetical protein
MERKTISWKAPTQQPKANAIRPGSVSAYVLLTYYFDGKPAVGTTKKKGASTLAAVFLTDAIIPHLPGKKDKPEEFVPNPPIELKVGDIRNVNIFTTIENPALGSVHFLEGLRQDVYISPDVEKYPEPMISVHGARASEVKDPLKVKSLLEEVEKAGLTFKVEEMKQNGQMLGMDVQRSFCTFGVGEKYELDGKNNLARIASPLMGDTDSKWVSYTDKDQKVKLALTGGTFSEANQTMARHGDFEFVIYHRLFEGSLARFQMDWQTFAFKIIPCLHGTLCCVSSPDKTTNVQLPDGLEYGIAGGTSFFPDLDIMVEKMGVRVDWAQIAGLFTNLEATRPAVVPVPTPDFSSSTAVNLLAWSGCIKYVPEFIDAGLAHLVLVSNHSITSVEDEAEFQALAIDAKIALLMKPQRKKAVFLVSDDPTFNVLHMVSTSDSGLPLGGVKLHSKKMRVEE